MSLSPGAVGIQVNDIELIDLASKHGFEVITPSVNSITGMSLSERKSLVQKLRENNLSWGSAGLPMDFRKSNTLFREGLNNLPKHAAALQSIGCTRMNTWVMPTHKELTYLENFTTL